MHKYCKRYLAILSSSAFMCLAVYPAYAQVSSGLNKDSLRNLLGKMPSDTTKVLTFITFGQQFEENQPDSALYFYEQARILSEKLGYTIGILKYISNYTAVLNMQSRFDESLKLNMEAVALSRKVGLKKQLLAAYSNVGAVYQHKDDKQSALEWYLKALPLLEEDGNQQNLGIFYGNICSLFSDLQQYDKAITAGKRSYDIGVKIKDFYVEGLAANNLGQVYIRLNKIPEALKYMQRTYETAQLMPSLYYKLSALLGLGTIYMRKQLPEKYMPIFRQALPIADSLQDIKGKVNALTGMGIGYYFLRRFNEAEQYFTQSVTLAKAYDLKANLKETFMHLSDLYIAKGMLEEGERMKGNYDSMGNELMNEMLAKNVQEMETKYQVKKHETDLLQKNLLIEKSKLQASRQRNWLLLSLAGLMLLIALVVYVYRFYRQKLAFEKQQREAMKTEQENIRLKALVEGQMQERQRISQEMHDDMGSGLTSILFLSHSLNKTSVTGNTLQVSEKLKNTASGLIEKMNEIIWMLNDKHDSLQDLLAYIRANVGEMVDNAGIDFKFDLPAEVPEIHLSQMHRRNIYLIIKEAVHNAIKHAQATCINIEICFQKGFSIIVADNGKGIDLSNKRLFSNGLRNMQERAQQMNSALQFQSDNGTTLKLEVDLQAA